jgi:hypothetical protein
MKNQDIKQLAKQLLKEMTAQQKPSLKQICEQMKVSYIG